MSNFVPGLVTGYLIGQNNQKNEDDKKRKKLLNQGKDQVLFVVDDDLSSVYNKIGSALDNVYYKEEDKCLWKRGLKFDVSALVISMFFTAIIAFIIIIINRHFFKSNIPLISITSSVALLLSILIGFIAGSDSKIDSIKIKEINKKTTICIKLYDSSGDRVWDDDEILQIALALDVEPIMAK